MAIRKSRPLDGQTALITGGGGGMGRAIALALAARGVRIVVAGDDERLLGETVGYVAHAGGKARHVVANVRVASEIDDAVAHTTETFGGIDLAIASSDARAPAGQSVLETNRIGALHLFPTALLALRERGRLVAVSRDRSADGAKVREIVGLVRETAVEGSARGVTCNLVVATRDDVEDAVAELVVFLCASTGDAITGQAIEVGGLATTLST